MRLAPLALLLCLLLAAPAAAHDLGADHSDTRDELAFADIVGTVETVDRAAGTEGEGLPLTWCGTERTTDDPVNAVFPPTTQQFKVVYAYAADRANRFAAWKDALQADVSLIGRFMGAQSGGAERRASTWAPTAGRSTSTCRSSRCPARARATRTT